MFSKVEECVEHCVHVCKAAVIDLAEPLLTHTVLLGDGLRLGWRCLTFLVLVEYSSVIWSVLIDNACMCFGIPRLLHIHLPKYHMFLVVNVQKQGTKRTNSQAPSE